MTCSAIVPPKYEGTAFMTNVPGPPGSSALCARSDELAHGFAEPCMQGRITNALIPSYIFPWEYGLQGSAVGAGVLHFAIKPGEIW